MLYARLQQIEQMALSLPESERRVLIDRLLQSMRNASALSSKPIDLHGAWKGRFPESFDIDAALRDIRQQWLRDQAA